MEKATCQVCGRAIKASTGFIAHHGYKRPYEGWQTASCEGARYEPYEVSCDRLREVTEMVRNFIATQEKEQSEFLANSPQTITFLERLSAWKPGKEVVYEKPEMFNKDRYYVRMYTYENAYDNKKYEYERTIKAAKSDLVTMERRIREWKAIAA